VFLPGLHPTGGHRPDCRAHVDFFPSGAQDFTGAGSRQYGKLKSTGTSTGLLPQPRHEGANVGVGHGGMVFNLLNLAAGR
jgi:hypothetical protein